MNPLEGTRRESVIIARQCLLSILHQKYNQSPSYLGRLVNKNHATILHCSKVVNNALYHRDIQYVDEVNRWSGIFEEIMPTSMETKNDLVDNICNLLDSSMLNKDSKELVLSAVLEKINNVYVSN